MGWTAHKIVLRLLSPLHVGRGKVGNLQLARPYVTGRNLWGALTARLARDGYPEGKPAPETYRDVGERVHQELAFTYLYPTTDAEGCAVLFPSLHPRGEWGYGRQNDGAAVMDGPTFRHHFLSTYASTALDYVHQSAEEASLHEVECLAPHTREGKPVYLTGYVLQQEHSDLDWRGALTRLQIGGERGYGWGRVELEALVALQGPEVSLFGTGAVASLGGEKVSVSLEKEQPLLAHALAADFGERRAVGSHRGPVEPLVGRETRPESSFGTHLSDARVCYPPGARADHPLTVQIGPFGVWEAA